MGWLAWVLMAMYPALFYLAYEIGRYKVYKEHEESSEKARWVSCKLDEEQAKRQALEIALMDQRRRDAQEGEEWKNDSGSIGNLGPFFD